MVAWFAGKRCTPSPRNHIHQVLIGVVLQSAVAGGFAHGTIERVIGKEQLQHELAKLDDLLTMRLDDHALADGGAAGSHRSTSPFYLHQAHATGTVGL
jgi:hypothetical protein